MTDIIIGVIISAVVIGAVAYIYRAKKSGQKCIGCPNSKSCSCGCCSDNNESR